jgi:TonB-linked SusC/RagA family outer membrane protein
MIATLFFSSTITAQKKGTEVSAIVVDEQGIPLSSVNVFGPKGIQTSTDAKGNFKITLLGDDSLVIQKKGYESILLSISSINDKITLKKSPFLASEDDEIKMGVTSKNRRDIIGAVSSIRPNERLNYDNTQFVRDYINGLMLGVRGSSNVRGIGNAIFVIDGVFGRDPNFLNMEEVEQITVLRDANAVALYGSQGRNGVIIINTKRGEANKREINVNLISGFRSPLSLPKYIGAADYMELFNEASLNDGVEADRLPFSSTDIANTRSGVNPFQYPDVDFYSEEYIKSFINTLNLITEFSGGNEKSRYYVNVGWNRLESWEKINPDVNKGTNRFNVRGNIDFRVNDWITSSIDGIAIVSSNKSAFSSLLNAGTSFKPNDYAPLLPINLLDVNARPESGLVDVLGAAESFDGFLLGATRQFQNNTPVAEALAGGTLNNIFRVTQFNNTINFDLSSITEGLTAKTYLSFDFFDSYREFTRNTYKVYAVEYTIPDPNNPNEEIIVNGWENGKIVGLTEFNENRRDQTRRVTTNNFLSRLGFYGLLNYKRTFSENHSINSTFLAYYNSQQRNNVIQTDRDSHLGFQVTYDFKKKLFADFSGAYLHSIKLPEGNRGGLSPTMGLAYILSEEDFIKDIDFINYFKVKASGGIIKSDIGIDGYFLYDENFSDGSNFVWADGQSSNRRQNVSQGANPDLTFEERVDLNLGFETYLMNSLWLDFNYFRTEIDKQLAFLNAEYPSFYNTFRPQNNFNNNLYTGFELGVNFNKSFKDFTVGVGANILYSQTEALKRSEINEFAYQNRVGRELSTIFGLEDQGFYRESDFTVDGDGNFILNSNLPVPNFGDVQPGDLKYRDQNGDNIIDNDDQIALGQSSSPWTYGVNLNLKYKGFNLFLLGTAQTGATGNKLTGFGQYFSVDGNDKYSEVVLGRWTPETANTATFPRLSSRNNQNNFRSSSFWLYDNSFFRLNRAQLTYEFTDTICEILGVQDFSFNVQGTNIFEISKNRDIRQLNVGSLNQFRTYTFGVRLSF